MRVLAFSMVILALTSGLGTGWGLCTGTAHADAEMPQARLPVESISIGTAKGPVFIRAELATNWAQHERGLMYRRAMDENAGMLFDFHRPIDISFWMKNTYLPLDILFIRANGRIARITANTVPMSLAPIPSGEPVRAVLELNAGQAAKLGIKEGALVRSSIFGDKRR